MERTYNVPLRKETQRAVRHKRTNRSVKALRTFIERHMKSEVVKIGKELNLFLWRHGARNPPHHVKVIASKDENGKVSVNLEGVKSEEVKAEEKKAKKIAKKAVKTPDSKEKAEVKVEKSEVKAPVEEKKAPVKETKEKKEEVAPSA